MNAYYTIISFVNRKSICGAKATWLLFGLVFVIILLKVTISSWAILNALSFSTLWKNPIAFFAFWLPKIYLSATIALPTLLTQKKWWIIPVMLIVDIWIIANVLYNNANNSFITWDSIMMVNNLAGFGSSIGFYWNKIASLIFVITLCLILILPFFKLEKIKYQKWFVIALIIVAYFIGETFYKKTAPTQVKNPISFYIPFWIPSEIQLDWMGTYDYVRRHSILSYLPTMVVCEVVDFFDKETIKLSDDEMEKVSHFIRNSNTDSKRVSKNLIFLMIESLESFALEVKDVDGNYFLPNLQCLTSSPNVLYANRMKSQVRHGVSIDGQQIYNTGILPLYEGVAAMQYGTNIYPNYAHFFDNAVISNPHFSTTWNQHVVTYSYGYKRLICENREMKDEETFEIMRNELSNLGDSSICYLALTIDSHTPFRRGPRKSTLKFDPNMPEVIQDYLNCLHTTDSCLGAWYNDWKETEQAKNTVLIIAGDHTVFKDATLKDLMPYAKQANLSIASGETFCPLIIRTPLVLENIQIADMCYQMDVYPTIMHLIDCEDYYWKGFGVNLLDPDAHNNRPITEEEASALSDKIIKADYFKEVIDSLEISL